MSIQPIEITINSDNGIQIASFNYYDGLKVIKDRNLTQSTSFTDVFKGSNFIVCCGDIMFKVLEIDYPEIQRRTI